MGRLYGAAGRGADASLFAREYPFDSFNTRDLHGVDDGVLRTLPSELFGRGDWTVLVAHFLGVDHVGHTHAADHPKMATKLAQIDDALGAMLARLDGDDAAGGAMTCAAAAATARRAARRGRRRAGGRLRPSTGRCRSCSCSATTA